MRPVFGLPAFLSLRRGFDPVVDGVADHMHQGFVEGVHHVPVDLGLLARHDEVHFLARLVRQVPDEADHLLEGLPDGDHAERHGDLLEVRGDPLELREIPCQFLVVERGEDRVLLDERLGDDELSDHVDQVVKLSRVDLDGALHGRAGHPFLFPQGFDHLLGLGLVLFDEDLAEAKPAVLLLQGQGILDVGFRDDALGAQDFAERGLSAFGLFPGGRRRLLAGLKRLQPDQEGVEIEGEGPDLSHFDLGLEVLDHALEDVHRLEDEVDDGVGDPEAVAPRVVEERLHGVGELVDPGEVEKTRHPFDRVKRPEDGVDALLVTRRLFQVDDVELDRLQVLHGLRDKIPVEVEVLGQGEGVPARRAIPGRQWRRTFHACQGLQGVPDRLLSRGRRRKVRMGHPGLDGLDPPAQQLKRRQRIRNLVEDDPFHHLLQSLGQPAHRIQPRFGTAPLDPLQLLEERAQRDHVVGFDEDGLQCELVDDLSESGRVPSHVDSFL